MKSSKENRDRGSKAEEIACEYLKNRGFVIVCKNFYTKFGEIDIVAKRGAIYHFVEVKSGFGFDPRYNLTKTKIKRVISSAQSYMKQKNIDEPYSIDAIIVENGEIEYIANITI